MLPYGARKYLILALEGMPDVLERLLKDVARDDTMWDLRPESERFTLREVLAHLADWEPIFLDRMTRTRVQSEPALQDYDEGQVALDHDYAHSDPHANLKRIRKGRAEMVAFLRSVADTEWERIGRHTAVGPITLEQQAVLIVGHDGYHTRQVAQWLAAGGR